MKSSNDSAAIEKTTAKKTVYSNHKDNTSLKFDETTFSFDNINTLIRDKKRTLITEECELKTRLQAMIGAVKQRLEFRQKTITHQITNTSLTVLEVIEKLNSLSPSQMEDQYSRDQISYLLQYRLALNLRDSRQVNEAVDELISLTPFDFDHNTAVRTASKPSREKYQQMISRLQSRLEKTMLEHQAAIQQVEQLREKLKKQNRQTSRNDSSSALALLQERYKQENQILVQQNGKVSQQVIELLSHNNTLKEKVSDLEEALKKTTQSLQKLEHRFNQPEKKVMEENKQLNKALIEQQHTIEKLYVQQEGLQKRCQETTIKLSQVSAQLDKKIQQLGESEHIIHQYEYMLPEKESLIVQLKFNLQREREINQRLQESYNNLEAKFDHQTLQMKEAAKNFENISSELRTLQQSIQSQKQKNTKLQEEKDNLASLLATLESKTAADQALISRFKKQKLEDDEQLVSYQLEIHNMQKEYVKVQQANLFEAQTQKLIQENRILKQRLQRVQSQFVASKKECESLQAEVNIIGSSLQNVGAKEKQAFAKKKQDILRKKEEERKVLQADYLHRLETFGREVASLKIQIAIIKQNSENQHRMADITLRYVKERASIQIISILQKAKNKSASPSEVFNLAERLVSSFSNLSHKEAVITKLKDEKSDLMKEVNDLRSKIQKLQAQGSKKTEKRASLAKGEPAKEKESEIENQLAQFNKDIYIQKLKSEKYLLEEKQKINEQKIVTLQTLIKKYEADRCEQEKRYDILLGEVKHASRRNNVSQEEVTAIANSQQLLEQQNFNLKNDMMKLASIIEGLRKEKEELAQEAKNKKQYNSTLKKQKQELEMVLAQLRQNLDQERQEHDKCKKVIRQAQRKEALYKDNKEKLDAVRTLERDNAELKRQLDEKAKAHKVELAKKDSLIKLLKEKENSVEQILQQSRAQVMGNSGLEEELNSTIRKLKSEIQRKDGVIKVLKQKCEKYEETFERERKENEKKSAREKAETEREMRKVEQSKLQNKKLESENYMFRNLLRKLFQNVCMRQPDSPKKEKIMSPKAQSFGELSLYSEGLSILNLNLQDFKNFLPGSKKEQPRREERVERDQMRPLEQLLSEQQVDGGALFDVLTRALDKISGSV